MRTWVAGRLRADYGIEVTSVERVTGGADHTASLWRVADGGGASYAVKVSRSDLSSGL